MRILLVWLLSLTTSIVVSAQQNAGTHSGRAVAETEIVGVQDALIAAYIHRDAVAAHQKTRFFDHAPVGE